MKKKILTMICVTVMVFALALPCFAESSTKIISTYTENLGNGISAVVRLKKQQCREEPQRRIQNQKTIIVVEPTLEERFWQQHFRITV